MNVRAKFVGGKLINRSQSWSWQARCAGAGLHITEGPSWGPKAWEMITSTLPSKTFKSVVVEKEQNINANRKKESPQYQLKQKERELSLPSKMNHERQERTTVNMTVEVMLMSQ